MLYFSKEEVLPLKISKRAKCSCCAEREAAWLAVEIDADTMKPVSTDGSLVTTCAWCLLYSNRMKWGYENRDELASVGQAAVALAANHGRELPVLDERHRLQPHDAERFVAGIFATSQALRGPLGRFVRRTHGS